MTYLEHLIAALEAAKGPSRQLDAHVAANIEGIGQGRGFEARKTGRWRWHGPGPLRSPWAKAPPYTGSIDAARTLLPSIRGNPRFHVYYEQRACPEGAHHWRIVSVGGFEPAFDVRGGTTPYEDPTGALALCIAALKARKALEDTK